MPDIFIDRARYSAGDTVHNWGDLLAALDADLGARGLVLTAVRFDGVDEPTFRRRSVTKRELSTIRQVHIETALPEALLQECLADAADAVAHIGDQVDRLAALFRRHELQPANQGLAQLARDLGTFVAVVHALRTPIGIDATRLTIDGLGPEAQIERLGSWLQSLIEAQRQEDWLTIADILEYDLAPALRLWRGRLQELRTGVHTSSSAG